MWNNLEIAIVSSAAGLFLLAAWQDFWRWKIGNRTILALVAAYLCLILVRWAASGSPDRSMLFAEIGAGLLLFLLGFALWSFGLFGAGDAKLLLPAGLFVGFPWLVTFALALMIAGVLFLLAVRFRVPAVYVAWPAVGRLDEIRRTGKVPYGVVITAATLFAMYARFRGAA